MQRMQSSVLLLLLFMAALEIIEVNSNQPGASTRQLAGSKYGSGPESTVFNIDDYPYIIYELGDSSDNIFSKLRKREDMFINNILDDYKSLWEDRKLGGIVQGIIIQHCIATILKMDFTLEEVKHLKIAIKSGLERSKARVESKGSNSEDESSVANIIANIKGLLQARGIEAKEVSKMLVEAKYIIRNYVKEDVFLSMSDQRIANCLFELLHEMDNSIPYGDMKNMVNVAEFKQVQQEKDVAPIGTRDINLMSRFRSKHSMEDDHPDKGSRNSDQVVFQNMLIRNHCIQKDMINKLSVESRYILEEARANKLIDYKTRLDILQSDVFWRRGIYSYEDEKKRICNYEHNCKLPTSLADLRGDFSLIEVSGTPEFRALKESDIQHLNEILSLWVEETILMSAIDQETYKALQDVFHLIDNETIEKEVKEVLEIDIEVKRNIYL